MKSWRDLRSIHISSLSFFRFAVSNINAKDNDFLNHTSESVSGWGYCVFGEVTAGIEVVEAIETVATGNSGFHADVPLETVIIESVDINE